MGAHSGPDPQDLNTHAFHSERLRVDVPSARDCKELYRLIGGDDRRAICESLVWDGPADSAEVEGWVQKCRTLTYGQWGFHWVVRDRTGVLTGTIDQPIGALGTNPRGPRGRADVGYWFGREYWGKGLATEALSRFVDFGFAKLGYKKIEANVYTTNVPGCRVVEKAGFQLEGTIRSAEQKYGEWKDVRGYGLLSPG